MINYNDYPTLLFTSYTKDDAPDSLPFELTSNHVSEYLVKSTGFNEMFGIIASLNSLQNTPKHFRLNDKQFSSVEYDSNFRNKHFTGFLSNLPDQIRYGVICFKDGGQYVYLYLPKDKATIKQVNGSYFAAAFFMKNLFVGFEEGLAFGKGVQVLNGGHYGPKNMDIGGFLSFVFVTLGFFSNQNLKKFPDQLNNTGESIWCS